MNGYRPNISSHNDRMAYLKKIAGMRQEPNKRWCEKHPTRHWGKKDNGEWFERCAGGNQLNEDCIVGKND